MRMLPPLLVVFVVMLTVSTSLLGKSPNKDEEYDFVLDTDRWVGIFRGKDQLVGKLNAQGDFVQSHKYPIGPLTMPPGPDYRVINGHSRKPRDAYEYRSGRLIKGVLDTEGNFVPEVGSKVILFKDYRFGTKSIPIWNLPGRFEKSKKQ